MPVTMAQTLGLSQRGEAEAQVLPPLLVRAEKVAASVILGVHGRKTAGPGESFWQYRNYAFGDSTQRVDWRRSARSDAVYIRENEWESANTLWVWANTGPRMDYKSHLSTMTKLDRAQIIATAMAVLAMRGHERIGALGSPRAAANGRMALLRVAEWIAEKRDTPIPQSNGKQKRAAIVLVSDFLDPIPDMQRSLTLLAEAGLKGHVVQIADPAEETLPFDGRNEFLGLDTIIDVPRPQNRKPAHRLRTSLRRTPPEIERPEPLIGLDLHSAQNRRSPLSRAAAALHTRGRPSPLCCRGWRVMQRKGPPQSFGQLPQQVGGAKQSCSTLALHHRDVACAKPRCLALSLPQLVGGAAQRAEGGLP